MDWRERVGIIIFLIVVSIVLLVVFNPRFYLTLFWGIGLLTGNVP